MNNPSVLYDANVLYSVTICDILIELAISGSFHAKWTDAIHREWIENLIKNRPDLSRARLERRRKKMDVAVRECLVVNYEHHIPNLTLPDLGDRHVLAAAIEAKCKYIITINLGDFPVNTLSLYGIKALHPDTFICELFESRPTITLMAFRNVRSRLVNPPYTPVEYLNNLHQQDLIDTAEKLHQNLDQI